MITHKLFIVSIGKKDIKEINGYKCKFAMKVRMSGKIKEIVNAEKLTSVHNGYNPNKYGWQDHEYIYVLDAKTISKIKEIVSCKKTPSAKTEEDKIFEWAKRLSYLTSMTIEEAKEIAQEKLEYKEECINALNDKQLCSYSNKRGVLIRQMERQNPLRRITNKEHAMSIISASKRHNNTNYDNLLKECHDLEEEKIIEKGTAKEYARANYNRY